MNARRLLAATLARHAAAILLLAAPLASPAIAQEAGDQIAWTQACQDWDEWDKPGPPFRIHGNSYYVGTCGIGSILITNEDGQFVIDSGTEAGADIVIANISALGFDPQEVELLLTSHEHHDHVGGMAKLQEITGADVMTSDAAAPVLRSGTASTQDPQASIHEPMQPVAKVGVYGPGNRYGFILERLGVSFLATPGHTPGALSWYWQSCDDGGDCKNIVYADSLSPISGDDYRFSDHPEYVAAYREGLAELAQLECDILLTPHPSASDMREKLLAGDLASGMNCAQYAAAVTARLDARLQEEAQAAQ